MRRLGALAALGAVVVSALVLGQAKPPTNSTTIATGGAGNHNGGLVVDGGLQAQVFTSTQHDAGGAFIMQAGQLICGDGPACAKTIQWTGFTWLATAVQAPSITVGSGVGFQPGVSVNTLHVAVVGKGHDYASFDSTASPGAANAGTFPMGKAAIAAAAGSVVITTSAVRALSSVFITPIDMDTTCLLHKVTSADGTFTVTTYSNAGVAANCAATWKFNWVVFGKSQYE